MIAGEPSRTDEPLETTLDSDASRALAIYAHEDLNVLPKWHLYPSARLEVIGQLASLAWTRTSHCSSNHIARLWNPCVP